MARYGLEWHDLTMFRLALFSAVRNNKKMGASNSNKKEQEKWVGLKTNVYVLIIVFVWKVRKKRVMLDFVLVSRTWSRGVGFVNRLNDSRL